MRWSMAAWCAPTRPWPAGAITPRGKPVPPPAASPRSAPGLASVRGSQWGCRRRARRTNAPAPMSASSSTKPSSAPFEVSRSATRSAASTVVSTGEDLVGLRRHYVDFEFRPSAGRPVRRSTVRTSARAAARRDPRSDRPVEDPRTPADDPGRVLRPLREEGRVLAPVGAPQGRLDRRRMGLDRSPSVAAGIVIQWFWERRLALWLRAVAQFQ